jgi:hypothetical protein
MTRIVNQYIGLYNIQSVLRQMNGLLSGKGGLPASGHHELRQDYQNGDKLSLL